MDVKKDYSSPYCPTCKSEKSYSARYDAYYCELCNKWLEVACNDPNCEYCAERPEKPSQCF